MSGFFKKALGVFVEFEDEPGQNKPEKASTQTTQSSPIQKSQPQAHAFNASEIEKFENHFEKMFEKANLPGPDYYEFWKTMETLEAHIPDERARISATFASLSIQGLTKEKLIETANKYAELIQQDKVHFDKVVNEKSEKDIGFRRKELQAQEETIAKNSELIQKLTKEITESQNTIGKLKTEILEEENKLARNKNGYHAACEAMITKITTDIQKLKSTL